jgi:propanol-preferring alcohol dehydrogenase
MQAWKCIVGQPLPYRVQAPVPTPGPEDVLIKVLAMGVCHSDCAILELKEPVNGMGTDFILGHEGVGEIVQLGAQVDTDRYKLGDCVGVHICAGCRRAECSNCQRGLFQLCRTDGGRYGIGKDGAFAEYIAIHSRAAIHIPTGLDTTHAAVAPDAVLTAYHAVKVTAAVQPDQTIAVYGLGGLGLNAVQTVLHLGVDPMRIYVIDKRQDAVSEALLLGIPRENAFCTADASAQPFHAVMAERNVAIDTTIDFVGHAETVLSAQLAVRPGGTLVLAGLLSQQTPLLPLVAVSKGLTIRALYNGDEQSFRECLDLMARGVLIPKVMTTSVEDLPAVLERLDKGMVNGRVVLLPDWKHSG